MVIGETRLGPKWAWAIAGLAVLTLGMGLGSSGRLTYHEAFVARTAAEMVASGDLVIPTLDGLPWLEKPPLAVWLVAGSGRIFGGVTELAARVPSALAALALALGVATFASHRFGPRVGALAGLIQVTTAWTIMRGRLAEADIFLACLVTWAMVALDRLRMAEAEVPGGSLGPHLQPAGHPRARPKFSREATPPHPNPPPRGGRGPDFAFGSVSLPVASLSGRLPSGRLPSGPLPTPWGRVRVGGPASPSTSESTTPISLAPAETTAAVRLDPEARDAPPAPAWRWAFFALVGLTSLVKGVGFGATLIGSAAVAVAIWDRDRVLFQAARSVKGWALAAALALAWPGLAAWRHPEALSLWTLHVSDRLAAHPEHFIGGPWWHYGPAVLLQAMPWTPLALLGAWPSARRAIRSRAGGDRLLWAWAIVPVLVLSAATVKNAHYAIHALPPWSVWAALGLARVAGRLEGRGWSPGRVRRAGFCLFAGSGLACGLGYLLVAPKLDRRGLEWDDCRAIGRMLDPSTPLAFLYEDWDRKPYYTPFGPVPHDWAVRLYYLDRPALWRQGVDDLAARPPSTGPYALLARDRDRPALDRLGRVEVLRKFPSIRFDRTFTLFRVAPGVATAAAPPVPRRRGEGIGRAPRFSLDRGDLDD